MEAEATGIHRDGPAAKPEYFLFNIGAVQHANSLLLEPACLTFKFDHESDM